MSTARTISIVLVFVFACCTTASACNIPVFRYALERWAPDPIEFVLFSKEATNGDAKDFVKQLDDAKLADGDLPLNSELVLTSPAPSGQYGELWQNVKQDAPNQLPYLVVRTELNEKEVNNWRGTLRHARESHLLDSPMRAELGKRLLAGHSIVWLMLKSENEAQNAKVRETLKDAFTKLSKEVKLPDGIGLPGSELYADVPLVLKFSILEIDPKDKRETYLIDLLSVFHPDALKEDQPLLAPVFGRGRALEVLPADSVDTALVGELTTFLCGACSCKVKGLNPGFDLLMAVDWDKDLFGEDGERPHDSESSGETPLPTLIAIPPGRN